MNINQIPKSNAFDAYAKNNVSIKSKKENVGKVSPPKSKGDTVVITTEATLRQKIIAEITAEEGIREKRIIQIKESIQNNSYTINATRIAAKMIDSAFGLML